MVNIKEDTHDGRESGTSKKGEENNQKKINNRPPCTYTHTCIYYDCKTLNLTFIKRGQPEKRRP